MHFKFTGGEPIYIQIASQLEEAIFTGVFSEGEQIPSTTEISRDFHINPATVLKGMNILVEAGLIEKRTWDRDVCCKWCADQIDWSKTRAVLQKLRRKHDFRS